MKNSHKSNITVRGYELDSNGHVNNAVYLQYYELARWEMMKDLGFLDQLKGSGLTVVVVESLVRYMRELCMFDELVVESTYEEKSPYLIFHQRIIDKKRNLPASRARIKTVFIGEDKVPQDIPGFLAKTTYQSF
jgi:YbgC/YbaW family acyl-CoA thioester hydrolase